MPRFSDLICITLPGLKCGMMTGMDGVLEGQKIRVVLVDDHPIVRDGIKLTLRDEPDIQVVGEAGTADEALQRVTELQPDIVLMDVQLQGRSGLESTVQLKALYPLLKVVILTVHSDRIYLSSALKAGASGYLLKDGPARLIPQTLRAAALGCSVVPSEILKGVVDDPARARRHTLQASELTVREIEVLSLIAEGCSNREIALKLALSEGTVKKYVQNLISKLGCKDRAHAAATALRGGILD